MASQNADTVHPDPFVRSQQSILSLDKSDAPFFAQINKACSILGIEMRMRDHWKEVIAVGDVPPTSDNATDHPNHAHALRWLLKKIQSAKACPFSPHLEVKAWVLFAKLIGLMPLKTVARLLKEFHFIKTLKETFYWLHEHCINENLPPPSGDHKKLVSSGSGSETDSSSSTEQDTARKRKIDGTEIVPHREPQGSTVDAENLYVVLCGVVKQLEDFADDVTHVHGYTAHHMRDALKSSPEEAAIILGSSIYVANHIIETPNRSSARNWPTPSWASRKRLEENTFASCISRMIEFWNLPFPGVRGPVDESQNHTFMRYCMLPSLHLLHSLQEWDHPKAEVDILKESLTSLLVKHVVLPFRESSNIKKQDKLNGAVPVTGFADTLTMSLRDFRFHQPRTKASARGDKKTKVHLTTTCLSLLFHVASRCRSKTTPQSQSFDKSWLESFLLQILSCASDFLESTSPTQAPKDYARLVKWLLRRALDDKVVLSTGTIGDILGRTSGLLGKEHDKDNVEWGIVGLCLLNGANVFLVPSTTAQATRDQGPQLPNKFLLALFSHITKDACMKSSLDDAGYSFKVESVILPLLRAFVDARNLSGFLVYWKEQLSVFHKECQPSVRSKNALTGLVAIWEDDMLSDAVASFCEPNLTAGQYKQFLEKAHRDLDCHDSVGDVWFSNIVVLDCVLSSCNREETLTKLAELAQSVFRTLADVSATKPALVTRYQWRLWRIKKAIIDRWGSGHVSQDLDGNAYSTAVIARDLLSSEVPTENSEAGRDYTDRLHSFDYLLSFAASDARLREIMRQAIEKIMDLKKLFCRQLSEDHFGVLKPLDTDPEWTGQSYGVKSIDSLYIGCIARLLQSKALRCLDASQSSSLFEQLYRLAIHRRTSPKATDPLCERRIDYDWLWQELNRSEVLKEDETLAASLINFQATQYLNLLGSKDPRYWDINTVQYSFAFETIQRIPSSAFGKRQRTEIANKILRIILHKKALGLATMTENIILLIKLLENPNSKMAILNNPSGLSREDPTEAEIRHEESTFEPALVVLADKIGNEFWSIDKVDCISALRLLTQLVTRHLMSTVTDGTSLRYLKSFYGWLSGWLGDGIDTSKFTLPRSLVTGIFVEFYRRQSAEFPNSLKKEIHTIDVLRQRHLQTLIDGTDAIPPSPCHPRFRYGYGLMLEMMVPYSDLLCIHPDLRNITARFAAAMHDMGDLNNHAELSSFGVDYLQNRLTKLEHALATFDHSLHPSILGTAQILSQLHSRERADLLRHFQKQMLTLSQQKKEELFNTLITEDRNINLHRENLEILQRLLFSIEGQQNEDLGPVLSQVPTTLCQNMLHADDVFISTISMQCMGILLQRTHPIISQWHVETLLATITTKSSQLQSTKDSPHIPCYYTGLCKLLTILLTRHRSKLGGRYHLLLPTLQTLLHHLFTPYTPPSTHNNSNQNKPNPPLSSPLTTTHATLYARLLTTLADPTPSSVRKSNNPKNHNLNDETKKAKSIAGQHLPYLIMEYCNCQLKGRLEPEIKSALMPGVCAVSDVMTKEGMRTMNAALDEGGRGVWKGVHEEWRRGR